LVPAFSVPFAALLGRIRYAIVLQWAQSLRS
jgi:hypothetical protein